MVDRDGVVQLLGRLALYCVNIITNNCSLSQQNTNGVSAPTSKFITCTCFVLWF